jgi:hypothetical protein
MFVIYKENLAHRLKFCVEKAKFIKDKLVGLDEETKRNKVFCRFTIMENTLFLIDLPEKNNARRFIEIKDDWYAAACIAGERAEEVFIYASDELFKRECVDKYHLVPSGIDDHNLWIYEQDIERFLSPVFHYKDSTPETNVALRKFVEEYDPIHKWYVVETPRTPDESSEKRRRAFIITANFYACQQISVGDYVIVFRDDSNSKIRNVVSIKEDEFKRLYVEWREK